MLRYQSHMNLKPMYFRKIVSIAIAGLSISLVITSCADISLPLVSEKKSYNSISGREGLDSEVLVVKIDDTPPAHPQIGLEDADLVYIEQVEGGLTRLAAVFSSRVPDRIGPVRSARITDIELLAQYGKIGFAYSGAQSKLRPVIAAANLFDVGAEKLGPSIYSNDPARTPPTAMVLHTKPLFDVINERGYQLSKAQSMGWSFGDAPVGGKSIDSVTVSWPSNSYTATWSDSEKRWLLSNRGIENVAESGVVLGPSTFVIQLVSITPSEYHDKVGGITPFSQTVGNGRGFILRNGKSFAATWSRPTPEEGTRWTLADGSEVSFAPGQIWVALTDRSPVWSVKSNSQASPESK